MTDRVVSPDHIVVKTRLFGPLTLPAERTIRFRRPLTGFTHAHRFVLLASHHGVTWLHGVDDPSLAFLTIDPRQFVEGYALELRPNERTADLDDGVVPTILGIVTLSQDTRKDCTVNLEAPITIDLHARTGVQLLLPHSRYGPRHPVELPIGLQVAAQVPASARR